MDDSEPGTDYQQQSGQPMDTVDAKPFSKLFGNGKKDKQSGFDKQDPVVIPAGEDVYNMSHEKRGVALVICNYKFNAMRERVGATKDSTKIYQTLNKLGFELRLRENLTKSQMQAEIEKVAKEDHTNADCFVCVLMSHGDSAGIYGSDDSPASVKEFAALFKGDKCRSLVGKPKMFFIQACRGEELDVGVEVTDSPFKKKKKKKMSCSLPTSADFLMSYSTFDDHFAFLNKKNGSTYIQSLGEELDVCEGTTEICTVLQRVTRRVAYGFVSNTDDPRFTKKKQCPIYTSSLTKQLYLNKKQ